MNQYTLLQLRTARTVFIEMGYTDTKMFKDIEDAIVECVRRLLNEIEL